MKTFKLSSLKNLLIVCLSLVLFASCASIVSRSRYPLHVDSQPSGANVEIIDKRGYTVLTGTTPTTFKLNSSSGFFSKAEYQVKISSPGFQEKTIFVSGKIDGWYFGNILIGGLLGMLIIDPATGAMWKLDTEYLNVSLNPLMLTGGSQLRIMDIKDVPEDWKNHLVSIEK